MALGDEINRTGIALPITKARLAYVPQISGNCLDVANVGDIAGSLTFDWSTTGWAVFFRANIRSTPLNAARLIVGDNSIILTVTAIQISQGGNTYTSDNFLIYNEWHDYAISWNGSHIRMYRDGVCVSTKAISTLPFTYGSPYYLLNRNDGLRNCNMQITNFCWYNKAFESEGIIAHYKNNSQDLEDCVFYYKFNEKSTGSANDDTVIDYSGNGNDITIAGSTWSTFSTPRNNMSYLGDTPISSLRQVVANRFIIPTTTQKSLSLDTSSDVAVTPLAPAITGFNIGFWFKQGVLVNGKSCLLWGAPGTSGFTLYVSASGILIFQAWNATVLKINISFGDFKKLYSGMHIVFTFIPNSFKHYVNSVYIGTDTDCTISAPVSGTLGIGRAGGNGNIFTAKNFTFQNTTTPWTQQQIDDLYWRNKIPDGAVQYSMNDVATDQNGENALTLTGTSYSTDVPPCMSPRTAV